MTDIIISGGGLVGATISIALAHEGLSSAIIDRECLESLQNPVSDGRTTAVSLASQRLFSTLGIWPFIKDDAAPITDIRVFEGGSPWAIYFDHKEIGSAPMGYIVDNHRLRKALYQRIEQEKDRIQWISPAKIQSRTFLDNSVHVDLDQEKSLTAQLLIVAEGRQSETCQALGIDYRRVSYDQKGLVFSVFHEKPHQGVAWEAFHPDGPLAFLPLNDCPITHRSRSGVVWSLPTITADMWFAQENDQITNKLFTQFSFLGKLEIDGKKWIYPLSSQLAKQIVSSRLVITGDAAHGYHPVAGQGVNVGWRDAAVLAEILGDAKKIGLDLGSLHLLKSYEKRRKVDTLSMFAMTDGMVRLFSNQSTILHFLRNAGLGAVNNLPPLKRFFMKRAMGLGGHLPRLMRV